MARELQQKLVKWMTGNRLILLALFVLAFVVRLIYVHQFSGFPTFYHLNIDQEYYNLWAKKIVSEGLLGKEIYEMTPLYAYFLAFIYGFISSSLYVVRLIQIIFGSLTVVFIYKLAWQLFDSRRIALISGLAAVFYGVFILYDGMVMKPFLSVFLAVMSLYWLTKLDGKSPAKFLLPGALVGLLILVRENAMLLIGGIPLCFFIKEGLGKAAVKRSAFFVIGAVLMILPVTLRNYAVGGEFVPITSGGGEVFYMAYYEGSNGYYVPPDFIKTANPLAEHEEFRQEAIRRTGRQMTRKESSDYWSSEGFKYFRKDPGRQLYLLYRKFIVFWNFYETPDNQNLYFMRVMTPAMRYTLGFGIIAPLGILGFFVSLKYWRRLLVIYAFFLAYMASVLITFYISRYRVPTVPILIIFSALYLDWLYTRLRDGSVRQLAVSLAILAFLLFGVNYRIDGVEPYRDYFTTEYNKLAKSYALDGNLADAKNAYLKMVALDPGFVDGHMGLGKIAIRERNFEEAIGHLAKVVSIEPDNSRAYLALAIAYKGLGRFEDAQAMLDRAMGLNKNLWRMN